MRETGVVVENRENEGTRDDGSDSRAPAYYEGSSVIFRASAVGGPSHVLAASLAGVDPVSHTPRTQRYMKEGVLHEPAIMDHLAQEGWMLHNIGRDQAELDIQITRRLFVRCHPDGFAVAQSDMPHGVTRGMKCVVEAKAMSDAVFATYNKKGFDEFYRYAVQLSLQMHGAGLPGLFAIKNRNDGEVRWQVLHEPPIPFSEIRKRLMLIEKGARDGNLNPLNEKCSQYPCIFHFLHDQEPAEVVADDTIDSLAEMVDRARSRKKLAEEIEKDAKRRLTEAMGEREKVYTAQWHVTIVKNSSSRFDRKSAEEKLGVSLDPYYTRTEYSYPLVKGVGLEEE